MKLSSDKLLRAEYIARIKSGAGREVLRHLDELAPEQARQPVFTHIRALALAYCGALEKAAVLWESLYTEGHWSEELVGELAAAYLALSRPEPAEALLKEWEVASEAPLSDVLAGCLIEALLAQQEKPKAESASRLADQHLSPQSLAQRLAKARAAVWVGNYPEVGRFLAPDSAGGDALPAAAELLRTHGHLPESLALLRQAISTDPTVVGIWRQLAAVLWQSGDQDGAMDVLAEAFEQFGEEPIVLEAIVRTCIDDRSYELAGLWLSRLEAVRGQEDILVRTLAAEVMLGLGDLQSVQNLLEPEDVSDESLDATRVSFYSRINRPDVAIEFQDRIVLAKSRSVDTLLARARLSAGAGRGSEVIALAEEVLARLPNSLAASALLVAHRAENVELSHLNRLRQALHRGNMPPQQRAWISHALADYHHGVRDYSIAADLYEFCNRLNEPPPELRYEGSKHRDWLDSITTAFDQAGSPGERVSCGEDMLPVFVVGVPRSGTTLTEQILSRHPHVTGMGECPHVSLSFGWFMELAAGGVDSRLPASALARCTEAELEQIRARFLALLQPHAAHISLRGRHFFLDKMPDNYGLIGWIFKLFPQAKVIYARRDPREIALSCWKANFGSINWAYRMEDIAERIVQHYTTMSVWLAMFEDRIFISDYADLVREPESQSRKMLEFLELDWDDACLDHTRASSVVRTASINQVRRPVYQTSLQSWRHYEQILSPAIAEFEKHGLLGRG